MPFHRYHASPARDSTARHNPPNPRRDRRSDGTAGQGWRRLGFGLGLCLVLFGFAYAEWPSREETHFCGPALKGRSAVYCTDTTYCEASVELARGADLLIHEATFVDEDAHLARQSTHSTATDAARVAREAGVRELILTHISPRYARGNPVEPAELIRQARAVFPATTLAEDFMNVEVARAG